MAPAIIAVALAVGAASLGSPVQPGRSIVGVVPSDLSRVEAALGRAGIPVVDRHLPGGLLIAGAHPSAVPRLPGVRFVEPDAEARADGTGGDPMAEEQWALAKIDVPGARRTTRGSAHVIVGVIDGGADLDHPDLRARLWRNPDEWIDGLDNDGNGFVDDIHGADCRGGDGVRADGNDHGTHVAGIIGATVDNGLGIAGVDAGARLMILRFLGADGRGSISHAIRCIDYAIAEGARITNHSWGTPVGSIALREAFARADAAGMLAVASAGNAGADSDEIPHYPSGYPFESIVSVAATTSYDALAVSSNRGRTSVDLAAPGVGILSTVRGGYAKKSGTSMAAPHVSAVAALIVAAHPGLTARAVKQRLLDGVDRTMELEGAVASGGRLNAARAVERDGLPPSEPVLHALTPLRTDRSVVVAWTAPEEDGGPGIGAVSRYELLVRRLGTTAVSRLAGPWPAPPGALERFEIMGLAAATAYEVVLVAADNAGNATASRPIVASTSA